MGLLAGCELHQRRRSCCFCHYGCFSLKQPCQIAYMPFWIDTHCHLDAPEFLGQIGAVHARALEHNITQCVIPAVGVSNFEAVRALAHALRCSYGLGIHPLFTPQAALADLQTLDDALTLRHADPRLVAVGEIGLDFFVPALIKAEAMAKQEAFYRAQLKLAKKHSLPVILHVRRSADRLLKHLRELMPPGGWRGIAHAFNGSEQQAHEFIKLGFKLGFGGAVTYEAARQLRRLATALPLSALVMETDSPDIVPQWLYTTAANRAAGQPQGRNKPSELPRIAQTVAQLRGISLDELALATTSNALHALPKLAALLSPAAC